VLWVLNAYSLLYAVLLITSARLGDIYGPRNMALILPIVVLVLAAMSAVFVRGRKAGEVAVHEEPAAVA
jgi:MFS family permease